MDNDTSPTPLPARFVAIAGTIRLALFFVILPWVLSLLGRRYGWSAGIPSLPNSLGLVLTGGGLFVLIWSISAHVSSFSKPSATDTFPPLLLVDGPYRFSRNPMYVADIAIWLGWALFYGSIPVFLATLCFMSILAFVSVPSEERQLLAQFGDKYSLYKSSVPRWVGRPHQPAP